MKQEIRTVRFDPQLKLEAYRFEGIMQRFPPHFHDYYVVGFIESGCRRMACNDKEYRIVSGDLILFNPKDLHTCEQIDERPLDYRCLNIGEDIMRQAIQEITGSDELPRFTEPVVHQSELTPSLRDLHRMILLEEPGFGKEEAFYFLIEQLVAQHASHGAPPTRELRPEIQAACSYLEQNYAKPITLDDLAAHTGLSKYYLLRSFTRQKGISPYRYLETIRTSRAKELLEQGVSPLDTAHRTGFSDQSHFTNFFKKYIGLTPRQYANIFSEAQPEPEDT